MNFRRFLLLAVSAACPLALGTTLHAQSSSAESNVFVLNTRDGLAPLQIASIQATSLAGETGGLRFSVSWASAAGARYHLQRSFDLPGAWTTVLEDVPPTPPLNTFSDELPAPVPPGVFYRLVMP